MYYLDAQRPNGFVDQGAAWLKELATAAQVARINGTWKTALIELQTENLGRRRCSVATVAP